MAGDVLASRGENKVKQVTKDNTPPNTNAYTGSKAQEALKRFAPGQMAIVVIIIVLAYQALKKK